MSSEINLRVGHIYEEPKGERVLIVSSIITIASMGPINKSDAQFKGSNGKTYFFDGECVDGVSDNLCRVYTGKEGVSYA